MVAEYPDKEIKILYYDVRLVYPNTWVNDGTSDKWVITYYWSDGRVSWDYKSERKKAFLDDNK